MPAFIWHGVDVPYAELRKVIRIYNSAPDALKSVEKRLADMAVTIKNITTYQKTKPVYEAYKKAKNKERFRAAHESDLILYEAAAKALRTANIGDKLPNVATLQAEYVKLTEQKEALYADYRKLKKQVKEYDTMKRNIDSFLKIYRGQARKKITTRE